MTRGWDDKAKEQAVAYFEDKNRREEFFKFFRQLEALYDVLAPDAFLRPYLEQYQALSELYLFIRHAYSDSPYIDKEITAKTRELLRQHSDGHRLELPSAMPEFALGPLGWSPARANIAAGIMTAGIDWLAHVLTDSINISHFGSFVALAVCVPFGAALYLGCALLLGVPEARQTPARIRARLP